MKTSPKIYAHRGASKQARENSLEAFQKGLDLGADGLEIDCVLTKDNVPVVTHNDDLSRLKLSKGCVGKKTWDEIRDLGIPPLSKVLEMILPTDARAILDIKAQPGKMFLTPYIVAGLAQEILPVNRVLLSSFYTRHLLTLRKHFRHMERAIILYQNVFKLVPASVFGKFHGVGGIHPFIKWTTPQLVQRWQKQKFEVNVWVANSRSEFERCKEMGVDGIFTDDPEFAKTVMDELSLKV